MLRTGVMHSRVLDKIEWGIGKLRWSIAMHGREHDKVEVGVGGADGGLRAFEVCYTGVYAQSCCRVDQHRGW